MTTQFLGSRLVKAGVDPSKLNPNGTGLYTAVFDPAIMVMHWSIYEVYKIVVQLPAAAGIVHWDVYIGQRPYEGYTSSLVATWSDPQPMRVDSGETIYFYFNNPVVSGNAPTVILWCQVDIDTAKVV